MLPFSHVTDLLFRIFRGRDFARAWEHCCIYKYSTELFHIDKLTARMITAAVGRVASIVLSLLISCGRVTTSTSTRCFDAESSFQKQGCVCNDFEQYTFISCAFLNGELPTSMSLNYSYVSGL